MNLEFQDTTRFPRGTIFSLLRDAYSFDPRLEACWRDNWQESDDFMSDNPEIAQKYSFITTLGGEPIGYLVWDPRKLPDRAEVGHNCILAKYKGRGYGNAQLREGVRRMWERGAARILVTTNELLTPACRNYESVGFKLIRARENSINPESAGRYLDYELTKPV